MLDLATFLESRRDALRARVLTIDRDNVPLQLSAETVLGGTFVVDSLQQQPFLLGDAGDGEMDVVCIRAGKMINSWFIVDDNDGGGVGLLSEFGFGAEGAGPSVHQEHVVSSELFRIL